MKNILYIILLVLSFIGVSIGTAYLVSRKNEKQKEANYLELTYHLLDYGTLVRGVIEDKKLSSNQHYRGVYLLNFTNGVHIAYNGTSRNMLYKTEPDFSRFINVGDSVSKKAQNDTIKVYKKDKEYYFILGKIINHPTRTNF